VASVEVFTAVVVSAAIAAVDRTAAIAAEDQGARCMGVVGVTEACADSRHLRVIPVQRGRGPGRAGVGFVTLRLAGTVLQDQAEARAWQEDRVVEPSPLERAVDAWPQTMPQLLTAIGTPSEAPAVWEPGAHSTVGAADSMAGVAASTAEDTVGAAGAIRVSALVGGWAGAWDSAGVGIRSGTGHRSRTTHGGTAIPRATFTRIRISK